MATEYQIIEKFTGDNWHLWKERIRFILIDKGLWKVVCGKYKKPTGSPVDPIELEKWEDADERALSAICQRLTGPEFMTTSKATSAQAAWRSLEETYEVKNTSSLLFLLRKFWTAQMNEGDNIVTHIGKLREMAEQLSSIGERISDTHFVMALLGSLPESYRTLVVSLGTRPPSELTLTMVTAQLLQQESHDKNMGSTSEAALAVGRKSKPHVHSYNSTGSSNDYKKDAKCRYCGKKGHYERECRTKEKDRKSGKLRKTFQKEQAHTVDKKDRRDDESVFVAALSVTISDKEWYIDSGASQHMTGNRSWFSSYENLPQGPKVYLGDDTALAIKGKGKISFQFPNNIQKDVHDILHVEGLAKNLLSVSKMTDQGYEVNFQANTCLMKRDNTTIKGVRHGSLYKLLGSFNDKKTSLIMETKQTSNKADLWHQRYGHLGISSLQKLQANDMVVHLDIGKHAKLKFCEGCVYGKQHRDGFPTQGGTRATQLLELIHSDVNGPMRTTSHGGAKYFVTFIDDFSRKTFVYFMKQKSEVLDHFKIFKALVEKQTGFEIQKLRSDNGGEYTSKAFKQFCEQHGIERQFSTPYTPQQNGVAERKNRTLFESARCMLQHKQLSNAWWAEAINTARYVLNRAPTTSVEGKTPEEVWSGKKPSVQHLRVFGCDAYAHVPDEKRTKLEPKSRKCIFLGYVEGTKCYRLYDVKNGSIIKSRDVKFVECDDSKQTKETLETPLDELAETKVKIESIETSSNLEHNTMDTVGDFNVDNLHHSPQIESSTSSVRDIRAQARALGQQRGASILSPISPPPLPMMTRARARVLAQQQIGESSLAWIPSKSSIPSACMAHAFHTSIEEPTTITEAMGRDDTWKWKEAMDSEYQSLIDNKTWTLTPLPLDRKSIGCKWIFKIKYTADGSVERYKARLVAKGYAQKEGIDYNETFAPVAKMTSIRILLALAAIEDLEVHQMDVKTAFLNGDLEEEIYMDQPEGYILEGEEQLVCKLSKTLYGLKQSPRAWYKKIDEYFASQSLIKSHVDPNIYVLRRSDGSFIIIALYVDDLMLVSNDMKLLLKTKRNLAGRFEMKDLEEIHYILGVQILRNRKIRKIYLSQQKYVENVLERFGMKDCKPLATPLDSNSKLTRDMSPQNPEEVEEMKEIPYQNAVGSLVYAMISTRADISYPVGVVSQYMANPGPQHWIAVKRILRYLQGTSNHVLQYGGSPLSLQVIGYCDADYAGDIDTRRSTTGYTFLLAGGAISWNSKKQPTVALSTTEAEYMAATHATKEAIWLQRFFKDIGFLQDSPMTIYSDNQSCISLSRNPTFHARTKHVEIQHHFVREKIESGDINLVFCGTEDMVADVLTKGLTREKHCKFKEMMGVIKLD
jgi:transposase InsO family protein